MTEDKPETRDDHFGESTLGGDYNLQKDPDIPLLRVVAVAYRKSITKLVTSRETWMGASYLILGNREENLG